ncbi:MAG: hypothetical protein QM817_31335 [Archangium sp.]
MLLFASLLIACEPPPPTPGIPEAPLFESMESPTPFANVKLKATAPPDARVRLFVDEACAGPVLKEVSSEALAEGVEVALVPLFDNVFSARAVTAKGERSECSTPLRVRFEPKTAPPRPTLKSTPPSPSLQPRFSLSGTAPDAAFVTLFQDTCGGAVLHVLSKERFESDGVLVVLPENTTRSFAVQSTDVTGQHSQCATISLLTDTVPPRVFRAEVTSPNPASSNSARLHVTGDFDMQTVRFYEHPHCLGSGFYGCDFGNGSCHFVVRLFEPETQWSIRAYDWLGNWRCVEGEETLVVDESLPPSTPELRANGVLLESRIPVSFPAAKVWFFSAPNCEGPVTWEKEEVDAVNSMFVDPGTVWSARVVPRPPIREPGKCGNTAVIPSN